MHYRNGREAKNGDKIVSLAGYGSSPVNINAIGILFDATPGNDYCNGSIASTIGGPVVGACLCDCLHVDDLAELLRSFGFTFHKSGMEPHAITVFRTGTSEAANCEEIDALLQRLNQPGLDKRPAGK